MRVTLTTSALAALTLAGCQRLPPPQPWPQVVSPPAEAFAGDRRVGPLTAAPGMAAPARPSDPTQPWRSRLSEGDSQRVLGVDEAWVSGLTAAGRRNADQLAALGPLARADAALDTPTPPVGDYRCRTIKLGGDKGLPYVAYGWFRCRISPGAGGELRFDKLTGSQRQSGTLYPWTDRSLAFVGAEAWGDEQAAPAYGENPERDEVGQLERIGPNRWRLLLAWPKQESVLDIIELVPAA